MKGNNPKSTSGGVKRLLGWRSSSVADTTGVPGVDWEQWLPGLRSHMNLLDRDYTYRAVREAEPDREAILGSTVAEVYGEQDFQTQLEPQLDRCLAGEQVSLQVWLNPLRQGRRFLDIRYAPLRDADSNVVGIIEDSRDITRVKLNNLKEETVDASTKMNNAQKLESLGLLAGRLAHDFNNMLTAVLGNANELSEALPADSELQHRVSTIEEASRRAAELCREMLLYAGKAELELKRIDVSEMVKDTAKLLEISASKKVMVKYLLDRNLPAAEGDASQLLQVLLALVNNASDAIGDDQGTVSICTGKLSCDRDYLSQCYFDDRLPMGDYVFIDIRDTGCGMDEATLTRLFDPFFSTKQERRGLGLAAALGVLRGHRGAIRVNSKPGQGTTVRLLLPCAGKVAQQAQAQQLPKEESWHGTGTILVVDDEEPVRELASRILERAGFSVLEAADGTEGVEMYRDRREEIDAVLLDLTMPRTSGSEALREMRQIKQEVRVLLSSGYDEQQVAEELGELAPAPFIQKPYKPQDLVHKLRQLFEADA